MGCLLTGMAAFTTTPTATDTLASFWYTTPRVVSPDEKFSITLAQPNGLWEDSGAIGFVREEIDTVEVVRNPGKWSVDLPSSAVCNSSNVQEPLPLKAFGTFPGLNRRVITFDNIVQRSGRYSVCYFDGFEWGTMPTTLVVIGPVTYIMDPPDLSVNSTFDVKVMGTALEAGDQWGISATQASCWQQSFILTGKIRYQHINLPVSTRVTIEAGGIATAGEYKVCYKYRDGAWYPVGPSMRVTAKVSAATETDGLSVGLIIAFVVIGLAGAVVLAIVLYFLWARRHVWKRALQIERSLDARDKLQKSGAMSPTMTMTHSGLMSPNRSGVLMSPNRSGVLMSPNRSGVLTAPNRSGFGNSQLRDDFAQPLDLVIASPRGVRQSSGWMHKPSKSSKFVPTSVTQPYQRLTETHSAPMQPQGSPGKGDLAARPPSGMVALDRAESERMGSEAGMDWDTDFYYDPITGDYWAYVSSSPSKVQAGTAGAFALAADPERPVREQFTEAMPNGGRPMTIQRASLDLTNTVYRPGLRKGNWLPVNDEEMHVCDQLRKEKRRDLLSMAASMGGTMGYGNQSGVMGASLISTTRDNAATLGSMTMRDGATLPMTTTLGNSMSLSSPFPGPFWCMHIGIE